MITVWTGLVMAVLDSNLVNVALPTMARDLQIAPSESIWIVNAYQLVIVMTLLPLAALADTVGYRRLYLGGLALFTASSLACALSDSLLTLTLSRIVQGVGAAAIMSLNLALIRLIIPPQRLGRAIGWNAMFVATTSTVGPTISSLILSVASWPWLFAINLPFGIMAIIIGLRALPENPRLGRPFDLTSALLNALTFGLIIVGIDGIAHGTSLGWIVLEVGAGILAGIWFVRRQLALAAPLLPVDLLRNPLFALSVAASVCSFMAASLTFVSLPFHFQHEMGFSAVMTGLLITAWPIGVVIMAPISGRLADRFPAGILGSIGLSALGLGLGLLALMPDQSAPLDVAWRLWICGLGFGLFQTPNNRVLISTAPPERSGAASGMLGTARLTGQTLGAALAALLLSLGASSTSVLSLIVGAGFALTGVALSSARLLSVQPKV